MPGKEKLDHAYALAAKRGSQMPRRRGIVDLSEFTGAFRIDPEHLADPTVVRELEDRGLFVFVDRDDDC